MLRRRFFLALVALGILAFALLVIKRLLSHHRANTMDVFGHNRQRHIALEAINAVIPANIESMHFKPIDRRRHR